MAQWHKDESVTFVNPYNFVRLSNKDVERGHDAEEEGGSLSGVIECTLRTRTPLAIPDMEGLPQDQAEGRVHKGLNLEHGVPFFRAPVDNLGEAPVIPGSEIRGVIRSAFEALDNGCLSVNNSNIASARSPLPLRPGILCAENGSLTLYEARKLKRGERAAVVVRRTWPDFYNKRRFKTLAFARGKKTDWQDGQIRNALHDYHVIVGIYEQNYDGRGRFEQGRTLVPKKLPSNGSWVVFFTQLDAVEGTNQEDILYIAPSQITRTVFHNRVNDLLGSHKSCTNSGDLCEACAVFGMVGKEGQASSRVRFADAVMKLRDDESVESRMIPAVTLKELSSPKPSSLEFYTKRPVKAGGNRVGNVGVSWTYDGVTFGYDKQRGRQPPIPQTERFSSDMPTLIRGRKFYLHHYVNEDEADQAIIADVRKEEKNERNMTVEVVRSRTDFEFKVFFERLDERQLERLVWSLCIGENSLDGKQLHMVGHGKPLGLGSSKIRVNQVLLRDFDKGYRLSDWDVANGLKRTSFPDQTVVQDFLAITDFTLTKGLKVSYPLADNGGSGPNAKASHNWFVANRSMGVGGKHRMTPSVHKALPKLPAPGKDGSVLVLPKYVQDGRRRYRDDNRFTTENEATVMMRTARRSTVGRKEGSASSKVDGREYGVIESVRINRKPDKTTCNGFIKRQGARHLFFHSSRSSQLDPTSLKQGMRVSFTIGKNTGGRDPNQDCAYDIRIE